jgi:hypothetical protein
MEATLGPAIPDCAVTFDRSFERCYGADCDTDRDAGGRHRRQREFERRLSLGRRSDRPANASASRAGDHYHDTYRDHGGDDRVHWFMHGHS